MRKEVILAVIIGVLLGGVILYGIYLANNSSKTSLADQDSKNNTQETPTAVITPANQISIIFPQDHSVVTESQLTLKGSTKPNFSLAIVTENDDIITTSDNSGNFSSLINLINGENIITVTAVDELQATTSATISIIRTTSLPE